MRYSRTEIFNHLDELCENNELGDKASVPYLQNMFNLDEGLANSWLNEWIHLNKPICKGCES